MFLIVFLLLFLAWESFAAATNTCVDCHTDEALMKSLHKPPVLPKSEGEG